MRVDAEVRIYEHLFTKENLGDIEDGKDVLDYLNPNSLEMIPHAKLEPSLANASPGSRVQFERLGIFLCRSRLEVRRSRIQSHRRAERHLGQGGKETGW